jgi:hypothetical protein
MCPKRLASGRRALVQNQPNPDTPVHERRWLDRLRAAWDEVRARPESEAKVKALQGVAQERPEEAAYRIDTFAADAARRSSPTRVPTKEGAVRGRGDRSDGPGRQATPESDRFDDEAGQ